MSDILTKLDVIEQLRRLRDANMAYAARNRLLEAVAGAARAEIAVMDHLRLDRAYTKRTRDALRALDAADAKEGEKG